MTYVPEFGRKIPSDVLIAVDKRLPGPDHPLFDEDKRIEHLSNLRRHLLEGLIDVALSSPEMDSFEQRMAFLTEADISLMSEFAFWRIGPGVEVELGDLRSDSEKTEKLIGEWKYFFEAMGKLRVWALKPKIPEEGYYLIMIRDESVYVDPEFPYNVGIVTRDELELGLGIKIEQLMSEDCVKMGPNG
jgi:hypothetical protein